MNDVPDTNPTKAETPAPKEALQGSLSSRIMVRWKRAQSWVMHLWVKPTPLPDDLTSVGINPDVPVLYVLDQYAWTSVLILDRCTADLSLPRPLDPHFSPPTGDDVTAIRSWAALKRLKGILFRRTQVRTHSRQLKRVLEFAIANPDFEIQIVPALVMVGRAPDKEESVAKLLFSEDWEVAGRLRRFFNLLINGRSTFVQFSRPISVRELLAEGLDQERSLRKVSRILRTHFRRVKEVAIGPDLSHRRTLIAEVVKSPRVREAIKASARRKKESESSQTRLAEKYVREIAANYSYTFVRIMARLLRWFWNRIYDGVHLNHFDEFRDDASGLAVVYVPCHRSHIDYALLSYLLYQNGYVPPHIAAGVNLNLPVVGSLIRRGGGFFLRRSFRSSPLYAVVFDEYVATILAKRVAMEYFIEGTRSRTGRLLQPKAGMLAMTVRGFLRAPLRDVLFQPVYFGYERLAEGQSYTAELSGKPKKSESLKDLLNIFRLLKRKYGKVHVNFGEPIRLMPLLEKHQPGWQSVDMETDDKPDWLNPVISDLANGIMTNINGAADVNPVNLLALIMLATPKQAIAEKDLVAQISLYQSLLNRSPVSDRVTVTDMTPDAIVDYGIRLGVLERREHALGDLIEVVEKEAVTLTYFRNNANHLVVLPAFVACCFIIQQRFGRARLTRLFSAVYPFIKSELFLPWSEAEAASALEKTISDLMERGLLSEERAGAMLVRPAGGSSEAIQLKLLGRTLLPTFERYYITVMALVRNGSGSLTRSELERLCILTAQRISQLVELDAPEFYDKTLFRHFIGLLTSRGILSRSEDGKLEFDRVLEQVVEDAKLLLGKDIRHNILQVTPAMLKDPESGADQETSTEETS